MGAAGNTAEMPSGGVLTNFIGKSGGNKLSGEAYYEYENKDLQSSNVTADQLARGPGYGIRLTPVWKSQQGYPYARVFSANAGEISQNFVTEALTAHRMETIKQFDIRAEKRFKLSGRMNLDVLFDVFNVMNANTELNIRATTATLSISETGIVIPALNTPITILPPRIARLSARLSW
ncbi:MAG: hypothetical protein JJE39_15895 [Vicinamibacteria bacterium]|nr:hypothetical protein [Vicinamibacteria bacterium]